MSEELLLDETDVKNLITDDVILNLKKLSFKTIKEAKRTII